MRPATTHKRFHNQNSISKTRVTMSAIPLRDRAHSAARRLAIGALGGAALVSVVAAPGMADSKPQPPETVSTVTSDALPTAQVNGVVWDQVIVGNTVYVTGSFTKARPPGVAAGGSGEVTRNNAMAFDLETGALKAWAPSLNAQGKSIAASADGSRVYIVGQFSTVNGTSSSRVVSLRSDSGSVDTSFTASANATVNAIAVSGDTVYLGGIFTAVNNTARTRLAAVSSTTGALRAWAPQADLPVQGLTVPQGIGNVVIAGHFATLTYVDPADPDNPVVTDAKGMGAVDAVSGAPRQWKINASVANYTENAAILTLKSVGDVVYGSSYDYYGPSEFEGSFAAKADDGAIIWLNGCKGDTYDVQPVGDVLYSVGHPHNCSPIGGHPQTEPWTFERALATTTVPDGVNLSGDYAGYPKPRLLHWSPTIEVGSFTGQAQSAWTVEGTSKYLVVGGEFPRVNGSAQQGLVRFTTADVAANKDGPRGSGEMNVQLVSLAPGAVRVSWKTVWDRDNRQITYDIQRRVPGGAWSTIHTMQQDSAWWNRPNVAFTDTQATPGTTVEYRIRFLDPWGNGGPTAATSTTVPEGSVASSPYRTAVASDGANAYWPLGEMSGTTGYDWAGANDLTLAGDVVRGAGGAMDGDLASRFPGTNNSVPAASVNAIPGPQTFTVEAWVNTTSTSGGKIVGFGNRNTAASNSYDRHVYMNNAGAISFGVYPGGVRRIASGPGFNDGAWHHIVASLSADGMVLYIDGVEVARDASTTAAQDYTGYWRIGGDNTNGWPGTGSSFYLNGSIDEVAIYPAALTDAQVRSHFKASGRTLSPVADFSVTKSDLDVTFDGSVSSDPDGSVEAWAWEFGDGSTGTGEQASHTYATAGIYTVGLTVTDDQGATATTSQSIKVGGRPADIYGSAVYDSDPELFWRLNEASGSAVLDTTLNGVDGIASGGYERATTGVVTGTSTSLNGSDGLLSSNDPVPGPSVYSQELWFQTTTNRGGKLIGFGNQQTGNSSSYDRHVYMFDDGRLRFGVWNGRADVIDSSSSYNDGQWHHMVATQGADGMKLYVDGQLVGTNPATTAQAYNGYWRVGGDVTWGGASSNYFAGLVDEVAVYGTVLTPQAVLSHFEAGSGPVVNEPPVADFSAEVTDLGVLVDAGASSDDGSIVSYAWDFGGQGAGSGVTASYTFAAAGTYDVKLTVTDDQGATGSVTKSVTVTAPVVNADPVADFSAEVTDLGVLVDAGASSDDGTIASYAWDFGGLAAGSGVTASYTFAAAGTYDVKLTVTDDQGATGSVTKSVTVTAPVVNADPVADFSAEVTDLGVLVDAGASSDDGSIVSYAWDFGGQGAGSGVTASYTFAAAGTYDVKLTVTDDQGATGSVTKSVTVTAPVVNADPVADFSAEVTDLGVLVDAGASSDDGSIVSYAWDFGGQGAGSGVTASYTFAAAGTYDVKLTVTDDQGATGSVTKSVTVTAPVVNADPVADFSAEVTDLGVLVDAGASSDDGSIVSYAWDFGGQGAGSGVTASYTFAAAGTYDVKLTVTDDQGATGSVTKSVTVTAPVVNADPVADFSAEVTDLGVLVDAGASSDDGSIVSYAWDFGGQGAGSGVTASYTFAAAGTYDVKLTVTDDQGATGSVTKSVTVTAPVAGVLAADAFGRSVSGGWGTADTGGAWALSGGSVSPFSVGGGVGRVTLTPGSSRQALLAINEVDTDVRLKAGLDKVATGGGMYMSVGARASGNSAYVARLRFLPDGVVWLHLQRNVNGAVSTLTGGTVSGLTVSAGDLVNLRFQVSGSPATLRAKAWAVGSDEPSAWNVTNTDSTASLQAAGGVSVLPYLSASTTNAPTVAIIDDLTVTPIGATPPSNVKPVAEFSATPVGLEVSFDADESSDSDGSIASYAWEFGDGATGTGKTPEHTYGAAGDYDVKLTVTDDDAASDSVTKSVTVTAPVVNSAPVAEFSATPVGLKVSFDADESSDSDGSIASYAWEFGDGATGTGKTPEHTYGAADDYDVKLTVTDDQGATGSVTKSVTVTAPVAGVLAADAFGRSVSGGWGTADTGGAWALSGGSVSPFSVGGGVGRVTLTPGSSRQALLAINEVDTDVRLKAGLDKVATGGGMYMSVGARASGNSAYVARLRFLPDGVVWLHLQRNVNGAVSTLTGGTVSGLTVSAGDLVNLRFQVSGSPATLRAKAWAVGSDEPSAWNVTNTDSTASLQAAGGVSVLPYLSASTTNAPTVAIIDDLTVTPIG